MWFWYAIASGFIIAISVVFSKYALKNVSTPIVTWALFTFSIPFLAFIVFQQGVPETTETFWYSTASSSFVFIFCKLIEFYAIKHATLDSFYPLWVFSTVFTYILGILFLNEQIALLPLIGIAVTLSGAYLLNINSAKNGIFQPILLVFKSKILFLVLIGVFLAGLSSIFDKVATTSLPTNKPAFVLLVENIMMSVFLFLFIMIRRTDTLKQLKKYGWLLLLMSVIYALGGIFTFSAFRYGAIALASAVKKTQILWVLLFGILFFKEKPTKYTWLASFIMILGIVLMKLQ